MWCRNNSLLEELPGLVGDVEGELAWASEAFGECWRARGGVRGWGGVGRALVEMGASCTPCMRHVLPVCLHLQVPAQTQSTFG